MVQDPVTQSPHFVDTILHTSRCDRLLRFGGGLVGGVDLIIRWTFNRIKDFAGDRILNVELFHYEYFIGLVGTSVFVLQKALSLAPVSRNLVQDASIADEVEM